MADANKTLITRAEVTSIITPATGRFALVMDGQTIDLGDTGVRDVSANLDPAKVSGIAAGQLLVRRSGKFNTVVISVTPSVAGNTQITKTGLGAGFAPEVNYFCQSPNGTVGITTAGNIYINPTVIGVRSQVVLTYDTSAAWPTTLPGVKRGDPVVLP